MTFLAEEMLLIKKQNKYLLVILENEMLYYQLPTDLLKATLRHQGSNLHKGHFPGYPPYCDESCLLSCAWNLGMFMKSCCKYQS